MSAKFLSYVVPFRSPKDEDRISLGAAVWTSPNPILTQKLDEKIIHVKVTKNGFSILRKPIKHSATVY